MKEDEYNLVCKGEIVQGFEQSDVIPKIAKLFKVDETVALRLLDKNPHVIKKRVNWQEALKYHKTLKDIGLVIFISLIFDANIFRESLIPAGEQTVQVSSRLTEPQKVTTNSNFPLQLMSLDIKNLISAIFSKAHEESILDDEGNAKFDLTSYSHHLNQKFLLLMSMFVALITQRYFTLIFVQYFSEQTSTILSIVIFLSIFLFLPRVMTPNQIFTLRNFGDDSAYLLCAQISSNNPFVDMYTIYSHDEDILAIVNKNKIKNRIECLDVEGNVIFTSYEEHNVDDVTKDVASEIRDNMFDFSIFEYIRFYSKGFKKIKKWINKERREYQRSDAFVVRDGNGKKVAYFLREDNSFLEYPSDLQNETESKRLIAFLLICIGVA